MKKTFSDILVQKSAKCGGCGLVELISEGCVIGYWESRKVDGDPFPEFRVVHDRLVSMSFDRDDFFEALKWGQKLAEVLV